MAPEQIRGETVDGRADLWAVGLVLYEMLTGRKPFAGEHDVAIAHSILHDEPVPPSALRSDVPAAAERLVLTLLRRDPATRYQSVDELMTDLAAVARLEAPAVRSRRPRWLRTRHVLPGRRRWLLPTAAVLVLATVGYTAIASRERGRLLSGSPRPVSRYSIALPETQSLADAGFWHHRIAISPNGDHLVYAGSADVNHRLWLRKRDQLHATPLAGTEYATFPFFSPDGSRVGFVSAGPPRAVKIVPLRGGPAITVTDSLVDGGGAWACGYIYFDARLEGDGVTRIPETGGRLEAVTVTHYASGEWWHFQPEPLPNCKGVLFVVWRGGDAREATVAVVDLESGSHRALVRGISPRYAASGHLLYVRADGTLMAVAFDQDKLRLAGEPMALAEGLGIVRGVHDLTVSATGTFVYTAAPSRAAARELVWVDRDGKAGPIDSAWRAVFTSVALSPDGKALAVGVQDDGSNHVWIKRLNRAPTKLTLEGDFHDRPAWTADGRAVVFVSRGRQNWDLYQRPVDGSAPPQLLVDQVEYLVDAEYSRDGKWLLYQEAYTLFAARTREDSARIRLVEFPSDASTPRGSLMRSNGQYTPRLSPDGRWLAYTSDEGMTGKSTGRDEVYVRPFPNTGSAKWQVSAGGGYEPRWSWNGRELYYKNFRGGLVAATVLPGATFAVGEQRVLFSTEGYLSNRGFRTYDVAPGGRFVMIRLTKQGRDELIWVDNFFEELKAKVKR
jgi:Tol biopolymer transport system component